MREHSFTIGRLEVALCRWAFPSCWRAGIPNPWRGRGVMLDAGRWSFDLVWRRKP